uniref:ZP domain-containing protein n=1 Tax=Cyclopterus lumpus TaxID=8103 RepID=A0A8C3AIQ1_CYCLU
SGENDCSHWATCTNAWASYTCSCRHGFIDNNPERPGRACQGTVSQCGHEKDFPTTTISAPVTPATFIRAAKNILMMGAISVQCRVAAITVTVAKDFLVSNKIREQTLYLGLRDCTVNGGNTSHAQLTVAWNECNTSLVHVSFVKVICLVKLLHFPTLSHDAPIICTYTKSMLISTDFGSMGYDIINDFITGSGLFQVTVQLTNGIMLLPKNHSLSSDETVVVEVSLNTSSEQMKVVINKCWATPTPTPTQNPKDTFLENSCSLNPYTNVLMNGNSSTSRVSVQIFSIVNLDVIYLHCLVHICVETGSDTCVPHVRLSIRGLAVQSPP